MAASRKDPLDFQKKFARILKKSDIKAFQWSEDGRCVIVNWKDFEANKGDHRKAMSIFRKVKDRTALRKLLACHGFKKIGRRSSSDFVFENPEFVRRHGNKTKHSEADAHQSGITEDRSPSTSISSVLADMCFSPIKKKNARDLYQYINFNYPEPTAEPEPHTPPELSPPPAKLLCTSPPVDQNQIPEELDDPANSMLNDPEPDENVAATTTD
ncbi:uncharacterized protein LOC134447790 [Engraulis encrasicolus]|uniref:uncharacterized protein LOC134447790 n=1 Tax=Engraulis encrasicolus TaxID=184585 RepID=UPI002FD19DB2